MVVPLKVTLISGHVNIQTHGKRWGRSVDSLVDSLVEQANILGIWLGFGLSLMIFSMVVGDNMLARLAQHVLVGAALGYGAVLAWQNVLRPWLFVPLFRTTPADLWLAVPLLLGIVLLSAGADRLLARGRIAPSSARAGWRRVVQRAGAITVAAVLGIGLSVTLLGLFQGTLIPQFWQTARLNTAQAPTSGALLSGVLTLLITIGVLLHVCVEPSYDAANAVFDAAGWDSTQLKRRVLQRIIAVWAGLGKRMLWLAAGVLFARLIAAHLSLLIARLEYFLQMLERTPMWHLADSIWALLSG